MVSGAWRSGVSQLSSLKSIAWKVKWIGPSPDELVARAGFGGAWVAGAGERAGTGALQSANKQTAANQQGALQLFMSGTAPPCLWLFYSGNFCSPRMDSRASAGAAGVPGCPPPALIP